MTESFEKELAALRAMGPEVFVLRGSTLIVEIQEPEEIKTKGGLIVAQHADHQKGQSVQAHRVDIGKVLMCGQGYWDQDIVIPGEIINETTVTCSTRGGFTPLECQPGAIVILPQFSTQAMSHFPGIQRPTGNKLVMVKMDQILAYYPTSEAYENAKKKLNA